MKPVVDYLVVIPKDEEFTYVREVVERGAKRSIPARMTPSPSLVYALARLPTVNGEATAVIISVGRMTEAPVQVAVEQAVSIWPPAAIVLVGIAGSLDPDRVKLGDVIVPTQVFGYTEAKAEVVDGRERMTYRPTGHRLDCDMSALARAVNLDRVRAWRASSRRAGRADTGLRQRLLDEETGDRPKLHIENNDNLASGNVVVASRAFAKAVREALGDYGTTARAVEMEAKGFCEALERVRPKPPALVVRGISDLADEGKAALEEGFRDGWRRYAAQNATRLLLELIYRRPEIEDDYRPVAFPTFPMQCHPNSAELCMKAQIQARVRGMRYLAFNPFMVCADGLPDLELTIETVSADGSPALFTDVLLRHADHTRGVLVRQQGLPTILHRFRRTGDPPALELLAGLPVNSVGIAVMARDEFGRETRTEWRSPLTGPDTILNMEPLNIPSSAEKAALTRIYAAFPSQHTHLYGRADELGDLGQLLSSKSPIRGLAIEAIGGMGKTALARELCVSQAIWNSFEFVLGAQALKRQIRINYRDPNGKLIVDEGEGVRRLKEFLVVVADQLEIDRTKFNDSQLEIDLEKAISEKLNSRSALFMLDNLETMVETEYVISVLQRMCSPPLQKALITTRSFPGAFPIGFESRRLGAIEDIAACRNLVMSQLDRARTHFGSNTAM
jgi:nucleoside phosphorylase